MPLEKYPFVVIVIPAYNEEASIGKVIKEIQKKYMDISNKGFWAEILVIDDGSIDRTVQVVRNAGVKVISHIINRGLGASTRTGLQRAYEMGADIAVKIDADFQHEPSDIEKVISPILEDKADCVFGSRFMGGLQYKMPLYRALGNKFFSRLISELTGLKISDAQTGLMAFGKRYLRNFEMISDYNETQQLIMDAWSRHMRIMEVPVIFHKRETGKSFISWRYPLKVLPPIFRLFVHINPLKIFIPLGMIFIMLGVIVAIALFNGMQRILGDATISIFIMVGIQVILFGFLADLMSKKR